MNEDYKALFRYVFNLKGWAFSVYETIREFFKAKNLFVFLMVLSIFVLFRFPRPKNLLWFTILVILSFILHLRIIWVNGEYKRLNRDRIGIPSKLERKMIKEEYKEQKREEELNKNNDVTKEG